MANSQELFLIKPGKVALLNCAFKKQARKDRCHDGIAVVVLLVAVFTALLEPVLQCPKLVDTLDAADSRDTLLQLANRGLLV